MSVEVLTSLGFEIRKDVLRHGLEHVIEQTGLKGRWQRLSEKPLTICDTAHNVDGVREVVQQIRLQQYNKLHIVLGMVRDKDITNVLKLLPTEATYYFCQAKIPRAMDANVLAEKASGLGLQGIVVDDVNKAIGEAKRNASTNDFIFIGGSTFVVAEINGL